MSLIDEKTYSPGLEGVFAGESALCQVDEGESGLRYRGYAVEDLATHAGFEEVAYLLLFGTLPTRKELERFNEQIAAGWDLPSPVQAFLREMPPDAHPMDILRTGVSVLGMTDPDAADHSHDANLRKAIRLLAHIPLMIASTYRRAHGKPMVWPKPGLSLADNLLWLLTDRQGDEISQAMARLLNVSLILYAEHEFNASTFAARVTASTMTDLHSAITAAIGTLKGPLHGGAKRLLPPCSATSEHRIKRSVGSGTHWRPNVV
jgi:Citrate synthase